VVADDQRRARARHAISVVDPRLEPPGQGAAEPGSGVGRGEELEERRGAGHRADVLPEGGDAPEDARRYSSIAPASRSQTSTSPASSTAFVVATPWPAT